MIGLVRVPVSAPDDSLSDLEKQVVRDAAGKLGYSVPARPLAAALERIGVVPFDAEAVRRYKWQREGRFMRSRRNICGAVALVLSPVCVLVWGLIADSVAIGIPALIATGSMVMATLFGLVQQEYRWFRVSLRGYKQPVPTFVLNTALRVQHAYPRAVLKVDERRRDLRPSSDPFLVVSDYAEGGFLSEMYWIEVWNEPDFSEQRQA